MPLFPAFLTLERQMSIVVCDALSLTVKNSVDVLHNYTASVLAAFVLVLQKVQLLRVDGTTTARDKTKT